MGQSPDKRSPTNIQTNPKTLDVKEIDMSSSTLTAAFRCMFTHVKMKVTPEAGKRHVGTPPSAKIKQ